MKHLKIDPVLIIADLKQQRLLIRNIESAAWRLFFRMYDRTDLSPFQIKPEKSLSQHCLKKRITLHRLVQSCLQRCLLHRFLQFTVKTEHAGVVFSGHQREMRAPHCPAFSILNILNPFLRFLNIKISLFRFFYHMMMPGSKGIFRSAFKKRIDIIKALLYMQKLDPKRKKTMQCTFDPVLLHFISGCQ